MKKQVINKSFKTIKEAEAYQTKLYTKYDCVKLVRSPLFSETGIYTWEVGEGI